MNQKGYVHLEITKNDRTYIFAMPLGAPLGEAFDAACDSLNEIASMTKQAADNAKPKTDESNVQ